MSLHTRFAGLDGLSTSADFLSSFSNSSASDAMLRPPPCRSHETRTAQGDPSYLRSSSLVGLHFHPFSSSLGVEPTSHGARILPSCLWILGEPCSGHLLCPIGPRIAVSNVFTLETELFSRSCRRAWSARHRIAVAIYIIIVGHAQATSSPSGHPLPCRMPMYPMLMGFLQVNVACTDRSSFS